MKRKNGILLAITLLVFCAATLSAQGARDRASRGVCSASSPLNGVYRINVESSDKLYSIIEGASSSVPYGEQQMFFNDLAVRLTPPDLLAIECRGSRVSLGLFTRPASRVCRRRSYPQHTLLGRARCAFTHCVERGDLTLIQAEKPTII